MCDNMTNTTISITQETKKSLLKLGMKWETHESIIKKLIKRFAWKKIDDEWNEILANDEFIPLDELWINELFGVSSKNFSTKISKTSKKFPKSDTEIVKRTSK